MRRPTTLTLRQRVFLTLLPLVALVLGLGGAGTALLRHLGGLTDEILRENYASVVAMERLNESLERIDSSFQFALAGQTARAAAQYEANWKSYRESLGVEQGNITLPGEREAVERLTALTARYRAQGDAFYARAAGRSAAPARLLRARRASRRLQGAQGCVRRDPGDEPGQHGGGEPSGEGDRRGFGHGLGGGSRSRRRPRRLPGLEHESFARRSHQGAHEVGRRHQRGRPGADRELRAARRARRARGRVQSHGRSAPGVASLGGAANRGAPAGRREVPQHLRERCRRASSRARPTVAISRSTTRSRRCSGTHPAAS